MGRYDDNYNRYKLYAIDNKGEKIVFYEATSIEEVDQFTCNFLNRQDLLNVLNKRYNRNFVTFYIETRGKKQDINTPGKKIDDTIYMGNAIPPLEKLQQIYIDYLLEDRRRIKSSLGYFKPSFKDENVFLVEDYRVVSSVRHKVTSYMNIRKVYFELLKANKIKTVEVDLEEEQHEMDYGQSLINSIDTDYPHVEPERLISDNVNYISDNIMLDKVRDGEVEPFEYYDLDDYFNMSGRKGRRR